MTCYDSPNIEPGDTWSSYFANVTCHKIIDGTHAEVTILPYRGSSDRFIITEDILYNYLNEERPFTIIFPTVFFGTLTPGAIKCDTCSIEAPPDEPPDDLLGMLVYVKDKVIAIVASVGAIITSVTNIDVLVNNVRIKIDEAKNLITGLSSNINYEFDVLEIWFQDGLEELKIGIVGPLELYKTDILEAISTISIGDLSQIGEDLRAEIIQVGQNLSSTIISEMWDYIEEQLFEKEE